MKTLPLFIFLLMYQLTLAQAPDECVVVMKNPNGYTQYEKINDSTAQPKEYPFEQHRALVYFEQSDIRDLMFDIQRKRGKSSSEIEIDYKTGDRRGEWMICYVLNNAYSNKASIYFSNLQEEETMFNGRSIQLRNSLLPLVENFDSAASHYIYDLAIPTSVKPENARVQFKSKQENLYNLGWSKIKSRSTDYSEGSFIMNRANKNPQLASFTTNVKVEIGAGIYSLEGKKYPWGWAKQEVTKRIQLLEKELKAAGIVFLGIEGKGQTSSRDYFAQRFIIKMPLDADLIPISKMLKRSPHVLGYTIESKPTIYFLQYITKEADLEQVKTDLLSKFDFLIDVSPCSFLRD